MNIFLCPIPEDAPLHLARLLPSLPAWRRDAVGRMKSPEARYASVFGFCLVRFAFARESPAFDAVNWHFGANGKPFLPDSRLSFNLSHTAFAAAVVLSETDVGIDLEAVRPLRRRLTESFCSPDELAAADTAKDPASEVIRLWTQKEAEAKRTGFGIGQDLRLLDLTRVKSISVSPRGIPHWLSVSPCGEPLSQTTVEPEQLK